jgi:Uncharacterized conserved protein (COG2071)
VMSRAVPPARGAVEAISATRRQRASLERVRHRPFPLPHGPWVMGQSWVDLLFAHWRLPEAALRAVVPDAVPIDSYDGSAWIGITPFEIIGAHPRALPPLPWLSRFPELNVRTYTTIGGRPGIWFVSLDAAAPPRPSPPASRTGSRIDTRGWRSRDPNTASSTAARRSAPGLSCGRATSRLGP